MGSGISSNKSNTNQHKVALRKVWREADKTVISHRAHSTTSHSKREGWQTIRIFVSSTFKDFHAEREILVKKVQINVTVLLEDTNTSFE